jgi:hypothetical protein
MPSVWHLERITPMGVKQLPKEKKIVQHRDSENGRYVKKSYADKNPKTTQREERPKKGR